MNNERFFFDNNRVSCHSLLNNPPDNSVSMDTKRSELLMPRKAKQDRKLDRINELNRKK